VKISALPLDISNKQIKISQELSVRKFTWTVDRRQHTKPHYQTEPTWSARDDV